MKKKQVIFLVIVFTSGVAVIKILKNALFFLIFADDTKTLLTV